MRLKPRDLFTTAWYKISSPKIVSGFVKVETSAECNAQCVWCWMFKSRHKYKGLITVDNFKKFIDLNKLYFWAKKIGVQPFFNGESLVHSQIFEIFDYIVSNNVRLMDTI